MLKIPGVVIALLWGLLGPAAYGATQWVEGKNYFVIVPAQAPSVPAGKVEVTEVFSYACPACDHFYPVADRLAAALPPQAVMDYVPASFSPDEDWPMFQRAYYTAQILGLDKRTHDAMFDAVWKSGELATVDPRTNQLKKPAPSIEDAAKFYARVGGVQPQAFVTAAQSFGVDVKIRQAEQFIRACGVDRTPTIIVNGKYRVTEASAGGDGQLIDLVKWLVTTAGAGSPAQRAK